MKFTYSLLTSVTASLIALSLPSPAMAVDYLTGSVGYFDAIRKKDTAASFGLEYRVSPIFHGVRPIVGGFVTTDGGVYGYGGINWDVALLPNQLYLIPNFAVGAYSKGDGRDLGGTLEFRSGIELAYQFPNTHQLGVAINHISNASIYDRNPGEETVLINYSIPVGYLIGR